MTNEELQKLVTEMNDLDMEYNEVYAELQEIDAARAEIRTQLDAAGRLDLLGETERKEQ